MCKELFCKNNGTFIDDVKGKFPHNIFAGKQKHRMLLWQPPEEECIKINVDGSYVKATGEVSVGVIIRDHKGRVLLSSWRYMFQCTSAEEAELLAYKECLWLAHQ